MALCYKDTTFCASDCTNEKCWLFITDQLRRDAETFGLPLAVAEFNQRCLEYKPNIEEA